MYDSVVSSAGDGLAIVIDPVLVLSESSCSGQQLLLLWKSDFVRFAAIDCMRLRREWRIGRSRECPGHFGWGALQGC